MWYLLLTGAFLVGEQPTGAFTAGRCRRCPPTSEGFPARKSIRSRFSTRPMDGRLASAESRIFPLAARVLPTRRLTKSRLNSSCRGWKGSSALRSKMAQRKGTWRSFPRVKGDEFSSNRLPALAYRWSMIFSKNRSPPRIECGAGFFGIMR